MTPAEPRRWGSALLGTAALLVSLLFLWGAFSVLGSLLLSVPAPTHDVLVQPDGLLE